MGMSRLWLACCEASEYARVRAEIERRDAAPLILAADLTVMAATTAEGFILAGAVLCIPDRAAVDAAERVIRLARTCRADQVIVVVDSLDPHYIDRIFDAGATEVVAARDLPPSRVMDAHGTHAGGGQPADGRMGVAHDDDVVEVSRGTAGLVSNSPEADHDRAPRTTASGTGAPRHFSAPAVPAPPMSAPPVPGDVPAPFEEMCPQRDMPYKEPARVAERPSRPPAAEAPVHQGVPEGPAAGGAPVVVALSGRGGCGASTLIAAMGCVAARLGLRTALIDDDLMFGNLYELFGAEPRDLALLLDAAKSSALDEEALVRTSLRIGPNLTLWGPVATPEQAEAMGPVMEALLATLRRESDVVLVDTSTFWGDAVGAAVAASDRCLLVGDQTASSTTSLKRVISLACRLGVPRTRMTSVLNRFGSASCGEDVAMRFEATIALSSRARVADGGAEVAEMAAIGKVAELMARPSTFATSVEALTRDVLRELGCPVRGHTAAPGDTGRLKFKLPWHKTGGGTR